MWIHIRNRSQRRSDCARYLPARTPSWPTDKKYSQCDRPDAAALHHYGTTQPSRPGARRCHRRPTGANLMMKKTRLDRVLVDRAIYPTREQAQRAVMAGQVRVGGQVADKASLLVDPNTVIATAFPPRFVVCGGLKLVGDFDAFHLVGVNWNAIYKV